MSNSDIITISEDCSTLELLRALVAKGEGRTVKVVKTKEAQASEEKAK